MFIDNNTGPAYEKLLEFEDWKPSAYLISTEMGVPEEETRVEFFKTPKELRGIPRNYTYQYGNTSEVFTSTLKTATGKAMKLKDLDMPNIARGIHISVRRDYHQGPVLGHDRFNYRRHYDSRPEMIWLRLGENFSEAK